MKAPGPEQASQPSHERTINQVTDLIQQDQLTNATELLNGLLLEDPENLMARHLLGICQRKAGQLDQAMQTQQAILSAAPDFAAAYQELGLSLRLAARRREALEAFRRATEIDPRLLNSWKFLGDMAAQLGDEETAVHAYAQYPASPDTDPMLERALSLIAGDKLGLADIVIRMYLKRQPQDARALYAQSAIAVQKGAITEALELLEATLKYAPEHQAARLDCVNLLSRRQRYEEALLHIDRLLALDPTSQSYRLLKASLLERSGQYETALRMVEAVLKENPTQSSVWARLGALQRIVGLRPECIASLHRAIDCDPDNGQPWYLLADLKTFEFTPGQVDAMRRSVERAPRNSEDEVYFSFALASALEGRGVVEEAFSYYLRGNKAQATRSVFSPVQYANYISSVKSSTTSDVFEDLEGSGFDDPSPIFVVGLPRAGSTLVEQILTSHSSVDGMMELAHLSSLVKELNYRQQKKNRSPYPLALAEIDRSECLEIGREYIKRSRILRRSAPFFVDKMPNNFEHIGLIHLILPRARIIDVRRDPMANGFSAFKQLFQAGNEWSYKLEHIGGYYRAYLDLMAHWDRMLPGKVYRVNYEQLVQQPGEEIRNLLAWLELPFEQDCAAPHENARAVRTASSEQVRQPIYRDALEHWKLFETKLEPLRLALSGESETR
jgi:tetratricopeptide (TPR) repeat protein